MTLKSVGFVNFVVSVVLDPYIISLFRNCMLRERSISQHVASKIVSELCSIIVSQPCERANWYNLFCVAAFTDT